MHETAAILFVLGLGLLVLGGHGLVQGASRLAARLGLSPLVVGLTVVAYGTSAPELAVSLRAALAGQADIALGNVVGSNVFNVLGVLGLSAVVAPLVVSGQLVRVDVPIMIGLSAAVFGLGMDGRIFNLVSVLGLTALIAPGGVAVPGAALAFDLPVMIAVAVACPSSPPATSWRAGRERSSSPTTAPTRCSW